jgi:hypothetical protein
LPGVVDAPTFTVIVDEPPLETEAGLKLALVPDGTPLALRLTLCEPPLVTAVEMVDVPLPACPTVRDAGLAEIEKSDGPVLQPVNLNVPIRVCQLNVPFAAMYSSVYQNVQSSAGSMLMLV